VYGIKAMRVIQKIGRRFGRTSDAGHFSYLVRLDIHFKTSLHDGGADRIMPAAAAQSRYDPFVIFFGESDLIDRKLGVMKFWFYIGHAVMAVEWL
jgi:hypothetical protein